MAAHRSQFLAAFPDRHVARPELVRQIRQRRVVALVAPGGYGKSVLLLEVAAAHLGHTVIVDVGDQDGDVAAQIEHILAPMGLDALAAPRALETVQRIRRRFERRKTPILLVVDEAGPQHGDALSVLTEAIPAPHRLVMAGRTSPVDLAAWSTRPDHLVLDREALSFTTEQAAQLLGDRITLAMPDAVIEALCTSTGGWVTALDALAGVLLTAPSPDGVARELLADNVVLGTLIDRLIAHTTAAERDVLAQAAMLPALDRAVARSCGIEGAIRTAHAAGLPWHIPDVGPWTVADPVAEYLARGSRPDPAFAQAAAAAYVSSRQHLDAVTVLRRTGLPVEAVAVLAEAPTHHLRAHPLPAVVTAIESLPSDVRRSCPAVEVQLVRMLTARSAYQRRNALIEDLAPRFASTAPEVARALEAERFRDLAYFSPEVDPSDLARITDHLHAVGEDHATRARLEEGLALLSLRAAGPGAEEAAEPGLRRAVEAFTLAGDTELAVLSLRNLAWLVYLEQGRLDRVIEAFDDIESRVPPGSRQIAVWRINRAETRMIRGELEEAAADLAEATRQAELHHDDLHLAYAAWATVALESMREEAMRTLAALGRADRLTGDWFDTTTGALYLAQTTDALARVGLAAEARERLQRTLARRAEDERSVDTATMGVEARLGDPDAALVVHERLKAGPLEPFEVPRLALLAAYARHRRGDEDAAAHAARAFVAYDAQGLLQASAVHEPMACRELAPLAAALGAPVPSQGGRRPARTPVGDGPIELTPALLVRQFGLRKREAEVLLALRTGGSNAAIAEELSISPGTVRKHLQRAYAALGVRSRTEALVLLNELSDDGR